MSAPDPQRRGLALLPVHRDPAVNPYVLKPLAGRSALDRSLDFARSLSASVGNVDIAVATDDPDIAAAAARHPGVYLPERTATGLQEALVEALSKSEAKFARQFRAVFVLEPLQPFRLLRWAREAWDMLDADPALDSVVCVEQVRGRLWAADSSLQTLADSLNRDPYGRNAPFRELVGLLLLSRREIIASGRRVGDHAGLLVVDRKWGMIDVRSAEGFEVAERLEPFFHSYEDDGAQPPTPAASQRT
jgi:hypothetical protein